MESGIADGLTCLDLTHLFESLLSGAAPFLVTMCESTIDRGHVLYLGQEFLCWTIMDDVDKMIKATKEKD